MGLLYSNYECNPVTNNQLHINAVSGTLTKTYKDSYFIRFGKGSYMEHFYFRENNPSRILSYQCPSSYHSLEENEEQYDSKIFKLKSVVVLQVMLCADDNYLVEAIDKENYDKMFEPINKNVGVCKGE